MRANGSCRCCQETRHGFLCIINMINSAHRTLDHTARRHGLSISLSTLPRSAVHNIRKRCMLSRHCSRLQSEVLSVCLSVCLSVFPLAHFREHTSTFPKLPVRVACDRGGVALYCRLLAVLCKPMTSRFQQVIAPRAARRYVHRRWQFDSRRIYVRPRRVRSPHISGGRSAAGSQRAYSLGSCATQPAFP